MEVVASEILFIEMLEKQLTKYNKVIFFARKRLKMNTDKP